MRIQWVLPAAWLPQKGDVIGQKSELAEDVASYLATQDSISKESEQNQQQQQQNTETEFRELGRVWLRLETLYV